MQPAKPYQSAEALPRRGTANSPWQPIAASLLLAEAGMATLSWSLLERIDGGYLFGGLLVCGLLWLVAGPNLHLFAGRLSESEEHARLLLQNAAIPVVFVSFDGRVFYVNELAAAYFGVPAGESPGLLASDFWSDAAQREDYIARLRRDGRVTGYEAALRTRSGETKWALLSANLTSFGSTPAVLTVVADITERRRQDEELTFFSEALKQCNEATVLADRSHRFRYVNPAFTRLFGYTLDDVRGQSIDLLETQDDAIHYADFQGESLRRAKDGRAIPIQLAVSSVLDRDGEVMGHVGIMTDMRQVKEQQKQLAIMAHYDVLTGVANRALLSDRMQQAMAQARRTETALAVCYLDLDGFKPINDQHGHETGDRVLVCVAQRLRASLREGDTVARLGGDEFVLILSGIEQVADNDAALRRILEAIAAPIELYGLTLHVSASLGLTYFPQDDASADTLLRHADQAMYRAKQAGKNRYCVFDPLVEA